MEQHGGTAGRTARADGAVIERGAGCQGARLRRVVGSQLRWTDPLRGPDSTPGSVARDRERDMRASDAGMNGHLDPFSLPPRSPRS